jgi:hypothetical protein
MDQVVGDPVALRLRWEEPNRLRSGADVRALLAQARTTAEVARVREALAPGSRRPGRSRARKPSPKEGEERRPAGEAKEAEGEARRRRTRSRPRRRRTRQEGRVEVQEEEEGRAEELEPDPITGVVEAEVSPRRGRAPALKLRLKLAKRGESAAVEGNLRCDAALDTLVELTAGSTATRRTLTARLGSKGWVELGRR